MFTCGKITGAFAAYNIDSTLMGATNLEKWFPVECRWASLEGTGTAPIPGIPLPPAASADGTCLNPYLEFRCHTVGTFFWYRVRHVQTIIEHCVNLFYFRDLLSCQFSFFQFCGSGIFSPDPGSDFFPSRI